VSLEEKDALRDVLWKMYQEHCTQGRHHEIQRAAVATALLGIAAAAIGVATLNKTLTKVDLAATLFLIAVGVFGLVFSYKHAERFELHTTRARAYRSELDTLLEGAPLKRLKEAADNKHNKKYPLMHQVRLRYLWGGIYLFLIVLGIILSAMAFWFPILPAGN
jgi:uncharacterized membrane protein